MNTKKDMKQFKEFLDFATFDDIQPFMVAYVGGEGTEEYALSYFKANPDTLNTMWDLVNEQPWRKNCFGDWVAKDLDGDVWVWVTNWERGEVIDLLEYNQKVHQLMTEEQYRCWLETEGHYVFADDKWVSPNIE